MPTNPSLVPTQITKGIPHPVEIHPNSSIFITFDIPVSSSNLMVIVDPEIKIYLRFAGIPSPSLNDYSSNGEVNVKFPQMGQWYAQITYQTSTSVPKNITITTNYNVCSNGAAGEHCNSTTPLDASKVIFGSVEANQWIYYSGMLCGWR